MTNEQHEIIRQLHEGVTILPGTWDKRFIRSMFFSKPNYNLSEGQNEWIFKLLYKYRKQIPGLYNIHKNHPLCKKHENLKTN